MSTDREHCGYIPSGVSEIEAEALVGLVDGKNVIEFGTWYGYSTLAMAPHAKMVVTVDIHEGDAQAGTEQTLRRFMANLALAQLKCKVVTIVGDFEQVAPYLSTRTFDMGFLDGLHTKDAVLRDLSLMANLLPLEGSVMACHDYGRRHRDTGELFEVEAAIAEWTPWQNGLWIKRVLVDSLFVMERVG